MSEEKGDAYAELSEAIRKHKKKRTKEEKKEKKEGREEDAVTCEGESSMRDNKRRKLVESEPVNEARGAPIAASHAHATSTTSTPLEANAAPPKQAHGLNTFPEFLAPIRDHLLVSPGLEKYWKKLYDTPVDSITPANKVLRVGPLLYRRNVLEPSLKDLFVRDVYSTLYELCNLDLKTVHDNVKIDVFDNPENFFFSGTPGVGKSCFRTYMIWRHIQELKAQKLTGVVWASRSPRDNTFAQILVIEGGEFKGGFKVRFVDTDIVTEFLSDAKIMTLAHVDVSKGDSDGISDAKVLTKFFYTSPNEAAWMEKSKDANPWCKVYYVPEFSEDELVEFFYDMLRHPELMRCLEERKGTRAAVAAEGGGQGAMMDDRSVARDVIVEEALEYGFVPRSMFQDKQMFEDRVNMAASKLEDSRYVVQSKTNRLDDSVRHSLLSFVVDPSDFRLIKHTKWRGAYVANRVVENLIKDISDHETQRSDLYKLFPADEKLFEVLFIGLFAQKPSFLLVERVVPPLEKKARGRAQRSEASVSSGAESDALGIDADLIRYDSSANGAVASSDSIISGSSSSSSSSSTSIKGANTNVLTEFVGVKFVSNSGMTAFAADINRRGVVAPVNKRYPAIDGIARFEHEGSIITAFLQVTRAASHPIGPEGLIVLEDLKRLAETAAAAGGGTMAKPHRCVFMWLCRAEVAKQGVSLDPNFPSDSMDQYLVSISVDKKPSQIAAASKTQKSETLTALSDPTVILTST